MAVGTIIGKTRSKVEVNSDLEEILEALSKKHNLIFFNFAWSTSLQKDIVKVK